MLDIIMSLFAKKKRKKKNEKKIDSREKNEPNSEIFYCNSNIINIYILHFSQIKVIFCVLWFKNDVHCTHSAQQSMMCKSLVQIERKSRNIASCI